MYPLSRLYLLLPCLALSGAQTPLAAAEERRLFSEESMRNLMHLAYQNPTTRLMMELIGNTPAIQRRIESDRRSAAEDAEKQPVVMREALRELRKPLSLPDTLLLLVAGDTEPWTNGAQVELYTSHIRPAFALCAQIGLEQIDGEQKSVPDFITKLKETTAEAVACDDALSNNVIRILLWNLLERSTASFSPTYSKIPSDLANEGIKALQGLLYRLVMSSPVPRIAASLIAHEEEAACLLESPEDFARYCTSESARFLVQTMVKTVSTYGTYATITAAEFRGMADFTDEEISELRAALSTVSAPDA